MLNSRVFLFGHPSIEIHKFSIFNFFYFSQLSTFFDDFLHHWDHLRTGLSSSTWWYWSPGVSAVLWNTKTIPNFIGDCKIVRFFFLRLLFYIFQLWVIFIDQILEFLLSAWIYTKLRMSYINIAILSFDHLLNHLLSRLTARYKSFAHQIMNVSLKAFVPTQIWLSNVDHHLV